MSMDVPMPSDVSGTIRQQVTAMLTRRSEIIEEFAERSLTDPLGRGVLVVEHEPPAFVMDEGWVYRLPDFSVGLSADVPSGQIHYTTESER